MRTLVPFFCLALAACVGPSGAGEVPDVAADGIDISRDGLTPQDLPEDLPEDLDVRESSDALEVIPEILPDLPVDPTWDGDGDGVPDLEEAAAGTDPADPADAPAWMPAWSGHPRLVFGPEDLPGLTAMAASPGPIHQVLLQRIEAAAAQEVPVHPEGGFDPSVTTARGRIAKAAAFLALVTGDEVMAAKAVEILSNLNPDIALITIDHPWFNKTDIHVAEGLASAAIAADWLLAVPTLSAADAAAVEASVMALALAFEHEVTVGQHWLMMVVAQNNHTIKTFASLALAGMVFNQRPEAARLVSRGVTQALYFLLDYQTTSDGGYAEGPSYLNYGAGEFWPMLWALHRVAGGGTISLRNFFDVRVQGDTPLLVDLPDPVASETLAALTRWPLRIAMPGGLMPNIDDSAMSPWCGAAFGAMFFGDEELMWLWRRPSQGLASSCGSLVAPELFAILPPVPSEGAPPGWTDQLLEPGGQAVFRTDWTEDATWLLLLGEHGPARAHGMGHEHPDATQVILAAHGETLLLDSGYVKWEEKDLVCHAQNHSTLLVDGAGPPDNYALAMVGADAWLTGWEVGDPWKTVVSSTSYGGADRARRVVLFPDGWLLIHDRIAAPSGHDWSWLLHGHGGGTSGGFEVLPAGGRWTRPGAWVQAEVVATQALPACGHHEDVHSFSYGQIETHEVLDCAWTGPAMDVLALVRFGPAGEAPPVDAMVTWGAGQGILSFDGPDGPVVVAVREPGAGAALVTSCGAVPPEGALQVVVCGDEGEPPTIRSWPQAP
ncbi:MAG: heparinase II/III family protein [Pseudomonadota bacterium]